MPCRIPYEMIIVDDSSPDGTQEVVTQLQQYFSKERVVRCVVSSDVYMNRVSSCLKLFMVTDMCFCTAGTCSAERETRFRCVSS